MTTNLPTTTSEITAEWMTEALRGSGTIGSDTLVPSVVLDTGASVQIGEMALRRLKTVTDRPVVAVVSVEHSTIAVNWPC